MKHFGTDIIRGIDLYQSEGARQFCFPSHTVLSLLRGEMRVRAGEKIFSFAGSGIILIPSGRKTDLFCEQSAVFLLIRISPAFLMEAFTRDRLLTEVISSHELPELLTLVPDLAALVPLFLESAELNRLAVNRLLFTFLERLDHTLGADAPSPDHTVSALQSRQKTVDSYITANIEKQLSLQETAAACGLTPQYLSSFFHKSMNCTFMEYINRIKAEKAREWLLASDLSPEEVCDAAGFKTYSAFCKSIEARYGSSWQQLQKDHVPSFAGLPAEDIIREPAAPLCAVPQILPDEENPAEPLLRLQKENVETETKPDRVLPDSWRTILNIGSANAILFDPFQRQLNDLNRIVSFRYCRMYSLMQLVTVYVSADKTYYGFELLFQILDSITSAGPTAPSKSTKTAIRPARTPSVLHIMAEMVLKLSSSPLTVPCPPSNPTSSRLPKSSDTCEPPKNSFLKTNPVSPRPTTYCPHAMICPTHSCGNARRTTVFMRGKALPRKRVAKITLMRNPGTSRASFT